MAKVEGVQSVPAPLLDSYRATLGEQRPNDVIEKRYPWRVKKMQEGGSGVSAAQVTQRNRFKTIRNNFNTVLAPERARWYAAMPPWSSFLWYYNYFMMSGLSGNADIPDGGAGVIKSIQVVKEEVPTTGAKSYTIAEVDPAKCVVMIQGNSYISDTVQRFSGIAADNTEVTKALSPNVNIAITEVRVRGGGGFEEIFEGTGEGLWGDWYCSYLSASEVKVKLLDLRSAETYGYFIEVIEHKAQTVYPVLVSIAVEAVVIDWALVPSVAADVSITVIEYI